ncbi:hypothetical protein PMZ80_007265 [Knufia obscura]|uniref:Uncharacterized protein n=1 Tax=Knufia obscura TaxID=1635080 RepID=A0ABR0RKQ6_9EURO|nr:hypothetical protein PMZ80_007265 [Knufia obscura]
MNAKGKQQDIAWNTALLTVPMLILTTIFFAFVFGYRVEREDEPFPNLRGNKSTLADDHAYYVDLNSTFLMFLASWMSSLAPMLSGFAITLAAYPIAARLFEDSMEDNRDRLLTPFQLNLALKLVNGSTWSGIWSWILYRLGWGKRVKGQGAALQSFLKVTLLVVFLSTLVFGADTWLHIVTKTVGLVQLSVVHSDSALYSLSLLGPNCTTTNNTISQLAEDGLICNMDPGTARLVQGTAAFQTLNNQSNAISVFNNGPNATVVYLGLSASEREDNHDFTATTLGMHTTCRPISQACGLGNSTEYSFTYNCSDGAFAGNLSIATTHNAIPQAYFIDMDSSEYSQGGVRNPYDYAVASSYQIPANPITNIANDPEILILAGELLSVILKCKVTLYDIEYDLVEGNITRLVTTPSNDSVVNVFVPGLEQTTFGWSSISSALQIASVIAEDAQDLADQFAIAYSKVALSVGAGSMVRTPALAAQERNTILVAKVPKAPLFLLVVINLIFVVMGFVLAVLAARTSQEAHEVQSRFGIAGIVANMFEGEKAARPADAVERLYGEYWEGNQTSRVGIHRTSTGGFVFKALDKEMSGISYHGGYQ